MLRGKLLVKQCHIDFQRLTLKYCLYQSTDTFALTTKIINTNNWILWVFGINFLFELILYFQYPYFKKNICMYICMYILAARKN